MQAAERVHKLRRIKDGNLTGCGPQLTSCVEQERLSGHKPQASWPHRHCQAVLEAAEASLATEGSLGVVSHSTVVCVPENHGYFSGTVTPSVIPSVQSTFPENCFPFFF